METILIILQAMMPEQRQRLKRSEQFGWKDENLLDLGDITGARATESILPIWLRVMGVIKTGVFNFRLIR